MVVGPGAWVFNLSPTPITPKVIINTFGVFFKTLGVIFNIFGLILLVNQSNDENMHEKQLFCHKNIRKKLDFVLFLVISCIFVPIIKDGNYGESQCYR